MRTEAAASEELQIGIVDPVEYRRVSIIKDEMLFYHSFYLIWCKVTQLLVMRSRAHVIIYQQKSGP